MPAQKEICFLKSLDQAKALPADGVEEMT